MGRQQKELQQQQHEAQQQRLSLCGEQQQLELLLPVLQQEKQLSIQSRDFKTAASLAEKILVRLNAVAVAAAAAALFAAAVAAVAAAVVTDVGLRLLLLLLLLLLLQECSGKIDNLKTKSAELEAQRAEITNVRIA